MPSIQSSIYLPQGAQRSDGLFRTVSPRLVRTISPWTSPGFGRTICEPVLDLDGLYVNQSWTWTDYLDCQSGSRLMIDFE